MKAGLLVLVILFSSGINHAQNAASSIGGKAAGLANASAALKDEWSLWNNPGAMAEIERVSMAFAQDVRPSLVGGNRLVALAALPFGPGAAAVGFFRFGDALYSEQLIAAGYSNRLGLASLGIRLDYIQYRTEGYATRSAFGFTIGCLATLTPQLSIGVYAANLNRPKFSSGERAPVRMAAGLIYTPIEKIKLLAEIEKDLAYDPTVKGAVEYRFIKKIYGRTGFNLNPYAAFFGMGLSAWYLTIDCALGYSPILGYSQQLSVSLFAWKRKKQDEK